MESSELTELVQSFAQWPILAFVLVFMFRFWRRNDESTLGIIAELRKSLADEKEARLNDTKKHDAEVQALRGRIVHLEKLLNFRYLHNPPDESRSYESD